MEKQRSAKEEKHLEEIKLWDENSFPALGVSDASFNPLSLHDLEPLTVTQEIPAE